MDNMWLLGVWGNYYSLSIAVGIFAPLTKISKPGILVSSQRPASASVTLSASVKLNHPKVDTSKVTAKVDTGWYCRGARYCFALLTTQWLINPGNGFLCIPTGLMKANRSLSVVNGPVDELEVGERVLVAGQRKGVIRFSGETDFAPGWKILMLFTWCCYETF